MPAAQAVTFARFQFFPHQRLLLDQERPVALGSRALEDPRRADRERGPDRQQGDAARPGVARHHRRRDQPPGPHRRPAQVPARRPGRQPLHHQHPGRGYSFVGVPRRSRPSPLPSRRRQSRRAPRSAPCRPRSRALSAATRSCAFWSSSSSSAGCSHDHRPRRHRQDDGRARRRRGRRRPLPRRHRASLTCRRSRCRVRAGHAGRGARHRPASETPLPSLSLRGGA